MLVERRSVVREMGEGVQGDIAMGRSQSYWLLSRLFLEPPDAAMLRELGQGLGRMAKRAGIEVVRLNAALGDALGSKRALADLQVSYARLLSSVSKTSGLELYESMAREGRLFGKSAEAVAAAYADAGYPGFAAEAGAPDHIGIELRFMSILCFREMEAWHRGDALEAGDLVKRELAFLHGHVLRWVPELCEFLAQLTTHSFYRGVARLAAAACRRDAEELGALVHECA